MTSLLTLRDVTSVVVLHKKIDRRRDCILFCPRHLQFGKFFPLPVLTGVSINMQHKKSCHYVYAIKFIGPQIPAPDIPANKRRFDSLFA